MDSASSLPPGLELVRRLEGHDAPIGQIAWSPDASLLASASKDSTVRIWDARTGTCLKVIEAHRQGARAVAFSRDGARLATGGDDDRIKLWTVGTWQEERTLSFPVCQCLAFGEGPRLVAGGSGMVSVWNSETGVETHNSPNHAGYFVGVTIDDSGTRWAAAGTDGSLIWSDGSDRPTALFSGATARSVAFHPAEPRVATGLEDGRVILSSVTGGTPATTLEGHTSSVRSVSYSRDGRLLASKSMDDVRLWDSRTGACLCVLPIRGTARWVPKLAFHPTALRLAIVGSALGAPARDTDNTSELDLSDRLIHILDLDYSLLGAAATPAVTYASAKIVLVGDSGVGKTGLGWRLAHGEFKEQASTHGQQFWTLDALSHVRADGAECEGVLWDLAGQPDYRLVHALFLDDADLALVLFDPTREDDPLHGVGYWLRQLAIGDAGTNGNALLVAARCDRGSARITSDDIQAYCASHGVTTFISTSALTGEGLGELLERMRMTIAWDEKPATVTSETFKRIKDRVLAMREDPEQKVIVTTDELRRQIEVDPSVPSFSEEEMLTASGHLAVHGYVARLTTTRGDARLLLAPELLNNVAASVVLEARRNEKGLGSLEEKLVLTNHYQFRELENLAEEDREILLDSAVGRFLAHNVCFREKDPLTGRVFLVFPELINLKKPVQEDASKFEEGAAYTIVGSVQNVYASLVVLLGYTPTFTRTNQWRNHARYTMGDGRVCGFTVEVESEGELELVAYYGPDVEAPVRGLFQGLLESFLMHRDVIVRRYDPVVCANGHRLNRAVAREKLKAVNPTVFCNDCGDRLDLTRAETEIQVSASRAPSLTSEHRVADARSRFEQVLFRLHTYARQEPLSAPSCFISYAWGDPAHEGWVQSKLAPDLEKSGVVVIFDRWEKTVGTSIPRFVERAASADRVIVVGTPLYRTKYDNRVSPDGHVAAAEGDLIGNRMIGSEADKETVLPVLLDGTPSSFPDLLRGRGYLDFRDPELYFPTMLELMLTLHGIAPRTPLASELRAILRGADEM